MPTKQLSPTQIPELQPVIELDSLAAAAARFPFTATSQSDAQIWQEACRRALAEIVGFLDTPQVDPNPQLVEEVDRDDFVRRKIVISTAPNVRVPLYLLVPKEAAQPRPVVIAYAGHGYGAKDIVGLWEDGTERYGGEGYHKDFAIGLCRRGFVVAAPEISCFGERRNDYSGLNTVMGQGEPTTCHNVATYAFMLGGSATGMRVRDGIRLIDYLQTIPEADTDRLGVMGISGGGMATFFHAALDERIRASVVSGYFSRFRDSILAMNHCTCNFIPGLLTIGEIDDLVGLIMPRPMLVEAGTYDPIFPIESVRRNVERTREICALLGGDPQSDVELDEFEGRHRISGERAYDFLWEKLNP
jgi:dienelactone hydrolase